MKFRTDFVTNSSSSGFVAITVYFKDGYSVSCSNEYDSGYGGYFWNGGDFRAAFYAAKTGPDILDAILTNTEDDDIIKESSDYNNFSLALTRTNSVDEIDRIEMEEETRFDDGDKKGFSLNVVIPNYRIPDFEKECAKETHNHKRSTASWGSDADESLELVDFGSYEWLVLDQNERGKLLITKEAIAARPYNAQGKECTWETCDLREWLNGAFLETFSEEDRKKILKTRVMNQGNTEYGTPGGNDTEDLVFLLSSEEAELLFQDNDARICKPNDQAVSDGAETYWGACWWWLRSPGHNSSSAARIGNDGIVGRYGIRIGSSHSAVRPALWVNL